MADELTPGAAGAAGAWAWKNRKEIGQTLEGLYQWFTDHWRWGRERRGILILGTGGAGKTTLARLLSGKHDWLFDNPADYRESVDVEKYSLKDAKDSAPVEIIVPPGQEHRREATWADLEADIGKGVFRGIIILAAYGYDTLGQIAVKDTRFYTGSKKEFLQKYLENCRLTELAILRELQPHIRLCPGKLWMLSLVAKQDLWWNKRNDVQRYYHDGEYGAELQKVVSQQDGNRFRHELVFSSLVISNFYTGTRELLQKNVAGYDHQMHVDSIRRLFQVVDGLKQWEESK